MFAHIMTGVFVLLGLAIGYGAAKAEDPRRLKVFTFAAAASAIVCIASPVMAGVVLQYWLALSMATVSPFKKSNFLKVVLSLALVAGSFVVIGMLAVIPVWLVVTFWSVFSVVGVVGWFHDNFGDIGIGGS